MEKKNTEKIGVTSRDTCTFSLSSLLSYSNRLPHRCPVQFTQSQTSTCVI